MNNWLTRAERRLASEGYFITEDVPVLGRSFRLVAHRARFELSKFGFFERSFIFREFEYLDTEALESFSAQAIRYAIQHKAIPLPRGLGNGVCCFAVAIADQVDEDIIVSVRQTEPPRHWAAVEVPVVCDLETEQLSYLERTPLWGSAYWSAFRADVQRILGD